MSNSRLLQLYPSKLTITQKRDPLEFHKVKFNRFCPSWLKSKKATAVANFDTVKNPFVISPASKRKIMQSINSMYVLSLPRSVEMKNGKLIYNFRLSFVTLTLPSSQQHDDVTIKKQCLNQFLVEMRKHYGVENYVWKAELQKNDNIHFHLVFDRYIDYQALRRRWNRILNKLGYVDAYQNKMQQLTLNQYHEMRNKNGKCDFQQSAAAFAAGKKANWLNPNTVDVRSVHKKKDLASYLAKYIAKSSSNSDKSPEQLEREIAFGRSWFRSYSLSRLQYKNKFLLSEMQTLIEYFERKADKVRKLVGDYFTVYFFSVEDLDKSFQAFHRKFMFANAKMYDYPFPT